MKPTSPQLLEDRAPVVQGQDNPKPLERRRFDSDPGARKDSATVRGIRIGMIPWKVAKPILERHHYLHSMPGGSLWNFGVFSGDRLLGAATFTCGPSLAYRIVEGANPENCATLSRLWLSDDLPKNSESRALGVILRLLRCYQKTVRFIVSYADPRVGHLGRIYQATNWLYVGLSENTGLFDLGDGKRWHTRTLSSLIGTSSVAEIGQYVRGAERVRGGAKHKYVYSLDHDWQGRLTIPILPYPKE